MDLKELNPPFIELPGGQDWFRVQRSRPRTDSVRRNGLIMAPVGTLSGRFDLIDEPCAYLADTRETSLYESLFRREAHSCPMAMLKYRSLALFRTSAWLRLVDIRGLEEAYPVLQSLRYGVTQAFAEQCRKAQAHGILYGSAQHPRHGCVCVFEEGVTRLEFVEAVPLVQPRSGRLHRSVIQAAGGSKVPIIS